jgi:serine/threonine protein kinase
MYVKLVDLLLTYSKNLSASLLKEIRVLTHPKLRAHPNIVRLFWYDLVEESNGVFTPALIMEQAVSGSLSDCLDAPRYPLSHEAKRSLCLDVCSGLLALHQASMVHGDVKSDNVLVFQSPVTPAEKIAKLTDFGSIISTIRPDEGEYPRYRGTPITNAPEVGDQSTIGRLDAIGLVRCDNYSLGLLIFQIITSNLDEDVTRKDFRVLERALNQLMRAILPDDMKGMFQRAFKHLLTYRPSDRCYDLSIIINLLQPLKTENLSLEKYEICPRDMVLP